MSHCKKKYKFYCNKQRVHECSRGGIGVWLYKSAQGCAAGIGIQSILDISMSNSSQTTDISK